MSGFRGITSPLWPVRYKPLPDELLSSWLIRLAHGHGLKVQTFCNLIYGNQRQLWNRDIDRLAPDWLIDSLVNATGTPYQRARQTTLSSYKGMLFTDIRQSGISTWVLSLQMYHRKRKGHGLQFCPYCFRTDEIRYYRKIWRLALSTQCFVHGCLLLDACPHCQSEVSPHRVDMLSKNQGLNYDLATCHVCGFYLAEANSSEPEIYDENSYAFAYQLNQLLNEQSLSDCYWLDWLNVLRHLIGLLTSRYKHVNLRAFIESQLICPNFPFSQEKISFEMRSIHERHHLLQLGLWLMLDPEEKLSMAWRNRAVRYNLLLKDFDVPPSWYQEIVSEFSNWRANLTI